MTRIDAGEVLARLNRAERDCIEAFEAFAQIGSTSSYLLHAAPPAAGHCRVAIADCQTAGRGRRDNSWRSPAGAGLWLSLAYTFADTPRDLAGLTLAVGAGIADSLRAAGADVRLKWPNDLMGDDAKLGGILTERRLQGDRGDTVVVGVGINVDLPAALCEELQAARGARATDLKTCLEVLPPRSALAAMLVRCLISSIEGFAAQGIVVCLEAWRRRDWLCGKFVTVQQDAGRLAGIASGIDAKGALLIRTGSGIERVVSGSVEVGHPAEACA